MAVLVALVLTGCGAGEDRARTDSSGPELSGGAKPSTKPETRSRGRSKKPDSPARRAAALLKEQYPKLLMSSVRIKSQ